MKHSCKLIGSALVWGLTAILWGGAALAVQGVAVAPPRFELLASPGDVVEQEVAVFAEDAGKQTINTAVLDWLLAPQNELQIIDPAKKAVPYSAAGWIRAALDPFELEPGKAVKVPFTVEVPKRPLAGSYWAALAFTTQPKPGRYQGVSVMVNTRVLAVVYLTIKGTEKPGSRLQGVTLSSGKDGVKRLIADVVNTGNVYLRLNGELRFIDSQGEVIERQKLPERVLLRDGLVRYSLELPKGPPQDAVLAAIEIQPKGPAGGFGGAPLYGEAPLR